MQEGDVTSAAKFNEKVYIVVNKNIIMFNLLKYMYIAIEKLTVYLVYSLLIK